jgi:MFS transporter, UMF1 family
VQVSEPTDQPAPGVRRDETTRRREQRSWCWYDWASSVFPTSIITVFFSLYLTTVARNDALAAGQTCPTRNALVDCNLSLFGWQFPAGSLFDYLLASATVLQVLVLPLTGAIVDRTQHKRRILGLFVVMGAGATALLALVTGTNWRLGVVLFIVATTGYYASVVVYYSVLPEIATADERDRLSSRGWAFGYLGGGLALALNVATYLGRDALGLSGSRSAVG